MLNSDIRDQAYQFFIEEVPELLEAIETGLLSLRQDRSIARVHEVMRAAHSIKGGAASVELDVIKTIAHRLETIFKALYDESVEVDASLETRLLQAYDCLRLPLVEQIETGTIDVEQALTAAEPVFVELEERLSGALAQADNYIPSSSDLGIDMVASIFEIDVAQGIERLALVLQQPEDYPVAAELHAQAEVFIGLAELLNLPGFGQIAATALTALEIQPAQATQILELALADFEAGRQAVLAGDRKQGGSSSPALLALAQAAASSSAGPDSATADQMSVQPPLALDGLTGESFGFDADPGSVNTSSSEFEHTEFTHKLHGSPEPDLDSELNTNLSTDLLFEEAPSFLELMAPFEIEAGDSDLSSGPLQFNTRGETSSLEVEINANASSDIADDESDATAFAETVFSEAGLFDTGLFDTGLPNALAESIFGEVTGEVIADEGKFQLAAIGETESESFASEPDTENVFALAAVANLSIEEDAEQDIPPLSDIFGDVQIEVNQIEVNQIEADQIEAAQNQAAQLDPEAWPSELTELADETANQTRADEPDISGTLESVSAVFDAPPIEPAPTIESLLQSAEQLFDSLPSLAERPPEPPAIPTVETPAAPAEEETAWKQYLRSGPTQPAQSNPAQAQAANLSVRVDIQRLERMNNLVGELAINRNSLALQNDQLQGSVRDLAERFERFQSTIGRLQDLSDRMLVTPAQRSPQPAAVGVTGSTALTASFDALEMDRYSLLHSELQEIFEQVMQIEEALGDISLFSGQSNQTLGEQRQKMTQLQNELMWARMLPLGNVLNRFPRLLRDLSTKYSKSVALKLSGTGVLVDKMVLEKLYDPLLHLLRNAFDHGIEVPEARLSQGKSEQGTIEIRAYHRGNQTLIEVIDDGKGLDLRRIGRRAVELGWLTPQELESAKSSQILDFIFEPGFSTAAQVSELSGRGVGLDVVRAQLRSLKGSVSASSTPGNGTTFTLRIPLTLTVAKLLTCAVGATAIAVPSDSIAEILVPQPGQLKQSGSQQFLHWREQLVPIHRMEQLLHYGCTVPERSTSEALTVVAAPKDWAAPLLVIQRDQRSFAVEVDRLITEQELVIKPFGASIAPPAYTYGCTILGDGSLVPVIDAATLIDLKLDREVRAPLRPAAPPVQPALSRAVKTLLVVDDSTTLRRMLALTLEKADYRVLQARDGQEALSQLQQGASIQLVICDIEMPNMNGFEFLSQRRQTPEFADIPVVMLTSRSNDKHRRLAMQLGATAYFSKPYVEHELLSALQSLLSPVQ